MGADLSKTRQSPPANHTFEILRVLTLGQRVAVPAVHLGEGDGKEAGLRLLVGQDR